MPSVFSEIKSGLLNVVILGKLRLIKVYTREIRRKC